MKLCALAFLLAAVVYVQCDHTFMGTNVLRPLVYHHDVQYSSRVFRKRVENLYFALPAVPSNFGRSIQILNQLKKQSHGPIESQPSIYATLAGAVRGGVTAHYISTQECLGKHVKPLGILAFDMTHTSATANVTQGGLGFNFVNLRMKSARGERIHFDVYVYA